MNDEELDALIRTAVRHDPARAGNALRAAERSILETIVNRTDVPEIEIEPAPKAQPRRGFLLGAAAAVAIVLALVPAYILEKGDQAILVPGSSIGLTNSPTGTRVLIDETGWTVDAASQEDADNWEVRLVKGQARVQVNAYAQSNFDGYLADRHVTDKTKRVPVLGTTGPLVEEGHDDWETFVRGRKGQMLDIRAELDRASFVDLLTRLRWVDDETWDEQMPAAVVTPAREKDVAEEMLADVPRPPGLTGLTPGYTNDRYQFIAHVTGRVVCRWIELDLRARADHDPKAQKQADDAMDSSRDWAVLKELEPHGGWSQSVWEYADALTKGAKVPGGSDDLTVADTYKDAFGC